MDIEMNNNNGNITNEIKISKKKTIIIEKKDENVCNMFIHLD